MELGFGADARPVSVGTEGAPGPWVKEKRGEGKKKPEVNKPIRQDLTPQLDLSHIMLAERGISEETARAFGVGFLDPEHSRGRLVGRLVFQVRGVREVEGRLERTVLGHLGRSATPEQTECDGKYLSYKGFRKTLELYGQDRLLLDRAAMLATISEGRIILVEGPLDCMKLAEAGILNVVASLGADLSDAQAGRIKQIIETLDIPPKALVWFDRDAPGTDGQDRALKTLQEAGIEAEGFDWTRTFTSDQRGGVSYPEAIQDPCDFTTEQLGWLRGEQVI